MCVRLPTVGAASVTIRGLEYIQMLVNGHRSDQTRRENLGNERKTSNKICFRKGLFAESLLHQKNNW